MNISTEMFGESGVSVRLITGEGTTTALTAESPGEPILENAAPPKGI
jgi:dCMP deaminase